MKINWIIYSLFILGLFSCENDLPLEENEHPSLLVINGFLEANLTENRIYLGLTGRDSVKELKDGKIEIYVNDYLQETTFFKDDSSIYINRYSTGYYPMNTSFHEGDHIKVLAYWKEQLASAEGTVPSSVAIQQVDTSSYVYKDNGWQQARARIKVTFTDPPEEKNYYRLRIVEQGKIAEGDTFFLWRNEHQLIANEDIVLTEGNPSSSEVENDMGIFDPSSNLYAVFDDSRLKGSYTMTVSINNINGYGYSYSPYKPIDSEIRTLKISLECISEAQYYYLRALNLYYSDNYDEMLSQPIQLPSNVKQGTGIIGLSNSQEYTMKWHEKKRKD